MSKKGALQRKAPFFLLSKELPSANDIRTIFLDKLYLIEKAIILAPYKIIAVGMKLLRNC